MPLVHGACSALGRGGQLHRSRTSASRTLVQCQLDGAFCAGSAACRTCRKAEWRRKQNRAPRRHRFFIRLPFLLAGFLLGTSLWYVARRLYGNVGGYIALGLFCFSPVMVGWSSQVGPGIIAAWGGFGLIFTAIAVAHTLYAPREVVLWNWRRILLLGLSIAICLGAQFSLWILLVPALAFMLWVGHVRRGAAIAIFAAACGIGLLLLWALYSFRPPLSPRRFPTQTGLRFPPATSPGRPSPRCSEGFSCRTELACCCCWR